MRDGGLSAERLKRLHDVMTGYVERGEVPGLVTLVARRGEGHIDAIGAMAADSEQPMRRDTIFRISSMTKPVTAAAAMILVEECLLRLDEPVNRLLPELANRQVLKRPDAELDDTVPAYRPITVRDLLTFTMGLGIVAAAPGTVPIADALSDLELGQGMPSPQTPPVPDEWIRRLGTLPLMYQPGERWMYNTGSDVLGVLIERASGQPFETFLSERIFGPLGMTDTGFGVPWDDLGRLATSYVIDPETQTAVVYDEPAGGQWSRLPSFPSGGGGLVSTVDDFLAFADMLRGKGVSRGDADPVPAVGRVHDQRPADPRAEGRVRAGARILPGARLGLRRRGRHRAHRGGEVGRHLRLGRRNGYVLVQRPGGGPHNDPDDAAGVGLPHPAPSLPGLLDRHLPGHRRLRPPGRPRGTAPARAGTAQRPRPGTTARWDNRPAGITAPTDWL